MNDLLRNAIAEANITGTSNDEANVVPMPTLPAAATATSSPKFFGHKTLDEKAVLVSVKRRMYSPYKLDTEESERYGAGNVNKHLFDGRNNLVKKTISKFTEVYTFVKDNTVPWTTGVDMLNINHYEMFTSKLRELIANAEASVADLVAHWDSEVQRDLSRLAQIAAAKGKPNLANPSDYPSADEIRDRFAIEVRFMPVPTTGDFRVAISDTDKASLAKQIADVEANAKKHVVEKMLSPMTAAIQKLAVPIGEDGSIFRDSLIDNLVDVAERMDCVNLSDDPALRQRITELKSLACNLAKGKDVLRNSQTARDNASTEISNMVNQMKGIL